MSQNNILIYQGFKDILCSGLPFIILFQTLLLPDVIQRSNVWIILAEIIIFTSYLYRYYITVVNSRSISNGHMNIQELIKMIIVRGQLLIFTFMLTPTALSDMWETNRYVWFLMFILVIMRIIASLFILPFTTPRGFGVKPEIYGQISRGDTGYLMSYGFIYWFIMNFTPENRCNIFVATLFVIAGSTNIVPEGLSFITGENGASVD